MGILRSSTPSTLDKLSDACRPRSLLHPCAMQTRANPNSWAHWSQIGLGIFTLVLPLGERELPQVGHNANERRLIFPGNVHIGYGCILYILSSTTSLFPNFQLVIQWSGKENFANMDTSLHRMSNLPCIWCCIDTDVIVRIPQSIAAWQQCRDRDSNS